MGYLKVNNISKEFALIKKNGKVVALQNFSFEVDSGEFVVIVGPTGCGKTTLLNIIAGFEIPTTGGVFADGNPINGASWQRTMIFQEYALFPWYTVRKNIEFGLKMKGLPRNECREKTENLIDLVELRGFENAYAHELSGGMRQRVAIARALAVEPMILLMDEPFGSLDAQTREYLQEILLRLWLRTRKIILFVTHSIDEAVRLGQRVIVMTRRPGRVKEIISVNSPHPRDIISDRKLMEIRAHIHSSISEEVSNRVSN